MERLWLILKQKMKSINSILKIVKLKAVFQPHTTKY